MTTTSKRTEEKKSSPKGQNAVVKVFVLDTSILMHDPTSLFQFEEHNLFIPLEVLFELDRNKKGSEEPARNAREAGRILKKIVNGSSDTRKGISLSGPSEGLATGRLFLQNVLTGKNVEMSLSGKKGDDAIIAVAKFLKEENIFPGSEIIFVTKDTLAYVKAATMEITVNDYKNDEAKPLEDSVLVRHGVHELTAEFWENHEVLDPQHKQGNQPTFLVQGEFCRNFLANEFLVSRDNHIPRYTSVVRKNDDIVTLRAVPDFSRRNYAVYGIMSRNEEQTFAFSLLMNPNLDLVMLLGKAGSGKTLLALAAGLQQTNEEHLYNEIIFARTTIPIGEEIGYLPGNETEKLMPWLGGLQDNLEVLVRAKMYERPGKVSNTMSVEDLLKEIVSVKDLGKIRGRSFSKKFIIIDEAQNLTPKQMKTLITRVGEGSKMILLGNLSQIDTPYLSERSSGLTYVTSKFGGWENSGSIILKKCARSRLADYAEKVL